MVRLAFGQFEIVLDNDPAYSFGSLDIPRIYDQSYRLDDEPYQPTSVHAVRVISIEDQTEIAACILGNWCIWYSRTLGYCQRRLTDHRSWSIHGIPALANAQIEQENADRLRNLFWRLSLDSESLLHFAREN
jgi:hypothetical protein